MDSAWCDPRALEQAAQLLERPASLAQLKSVRDRAEAVCKTARLLGLDQAEVDRAAEIRLRAERRLGELLGRMKLRGGNHRSPGGARSTLAQLGISAIQAHRWRTEASVSEAVFERYLDESARKGRTPTCRGLLQVAAELSCFGEKEGPAGRDGLAGRLEQLARRGAKFPTVLATPWIAAADVNGHVGGRCRRRRAAARLDALPLDRVASHNRGHLHLLAPVERLPDALKILRAWRFAYRSALVCTGFALRFGDYWRAGPQLLLLGVRGDLPLRDNAVEALVQLDHNAAGAADSLRRLVERVSPKPYLHVFGHGPRDGWTVLSHRLDQDYTV